MNGGVAQTDLVLPPVVIVKEGGLVTVADQGVDDTPPSADTLPLAKLKV